VERKCELLRLLDFEGADRRRRTTSGEEATGNLNRQRISKGGIGLLGVKGVKIDRGIRGNDDFFFLSSPKEVGWRRCLVEIDW